jgi:hypothetical protein
MKYESEKILNFSISQLGENSGYAIETCKKLLFST